jgi:hypothetical protein
MVPNGVGADEVFAAKSRSMEGLGPRLTRRLCEIVPGQNSLTCAPGIRFERAKGSRYFHKLIALPIPQSRTSDSQMNQHCEVNQEEDSWPGSKV